MATQNAINTGKPIEVGNGGTGQSSYTNGQLLIGNTTGNTLTKATLTAGTGIQITNGGGSITITSQGPSGVDPNIFDFRLTLVSGTPVMTTTQSAKTTLYLTPYKGNCLSLYTSSVWTFYTSAEMSLSLSGYTANKNYDIWVYDSSGTPTMDSTVWTNDTTRATALATQNGVYVKSGDASRRYVGTIRINSSGGQCDWKYGSAAAGGGAADFGVWNYNNRVSVATAVKDTTDSWTYGTATWRAVNNSATNRVSFVTGVAEDSVNAEYLAISLSNGSVYASTGIALNATNTFDVTGSFNSISTHAQSTYYVGTPAAGYNYLQATEYATGANITYYGDAGTAYIQSALTANLFC